MDKSFMRHSLHALHCPQCGIQYANEDIGLVKEVEDNIFATITCSKCQHQSVVSMTLAQGSASTNPSTDLRPTELAKVAGQAPIDTNDLLDIYQYLKKTKGNFTQDLDLSPKAKTKKP